jgi:hypothetical protein
VNGNRAVSEGGLVRKQPVERFDPEGCKNPEGECKPEAGGPGVAGNGQRAFAMKQPQRGEPLAAVEQTAERAWELQRWK